MLVPGSTFFYQWSAKFLNFLSEFARGTSLVAQVVKNSPANVGNSRDVGSIPWLGRSPEVGNGNPFQYSCLASSMDGEPDGLQSMGSRRVAHD